MNQNLLYHIGKLGGNASSSKQSQVIRRIILSDRNDKEKLEAIQEQLATRNIESDSVQLINKALMAHYGSEDQGLGGGNFELRSSFYRELILRFPNELSFQFKLSECYYLAGNPLEQLVAVLFPALKNDTDHQHSVGADVFEWIQSSPYAEQLNALLDGELPD